MSPSYFLETIGPETIDRAYPLVQAVIPHLLKHEWRQFCRSIELAEVGSLGKREEIVLARNATGYIKGLCFYAVRDHATYGRLIDVPFFVALSAADGEGVARELINFLRGQCDQYVCSGVRFWSVDQETWGRRAAPDYIARSDHGLFLPALTSDAATLTALRAHGITAIQAIDRLSR
jgi:hypothetical protein